MRQMIFFATFLLANATIGSALAASGIECVRVQCEGKGRTCVETLHVTYNACTKAARAKCEKVSPAEKFNCLRDGLKPCALTRNDEQAACLADVTSCYRACGPVQGKNVHYWCVGDFNEGVTAAFCEADPAASPRIPCTKAFNRPSSGEPSLTCAPLR
jgi:hypothetical protein